MYDMSHVAGLLAGGLFQPEAGALADIVTSSTGKSLHAPDHGLCLFNDPSLATGIHDAVQPLLTSNTHPHELAALGVALAEMRQFGRGYAEQVIRNGQSLCLALGQGRSSQWLASGQPSCHPSWHEGRGDGSHC